MIFSLIGNGGKEPNIGAIKIFVLLLRSEVIVMVGYYAFSFGPDMTFFIL